MADRNEHHPPDDVGIPSVDVCSFCADSECDGIGCIASLDPDNQADHEAIEQLHDLIRAGAAWKIMHTHGYTVAERVLAHAEHRDPRLAFEVMAAMATSTSPAPEVRRG